MTLDELLATLTAYGAKAWLEDGHLRVRVPAHLPVQVVDHMLVPAIRANHRDLLALLNGEDLAIKHRVELMRPDVTSPVFPFLTANASPPAIGRCLSCGDQVSEGRTYRCAPCARAAWMVINEAA